MDNLFNIILTIAATIGLIAIVTVLLTSVQETFGHRWDKVLASALPAESTRPVQALVEGLEAEKPVRRDALIKAQYGLLRASHPELLTLLALLEDGNRRASRSSFWSSLVQNAIFTTIGLIAGLFLSGVHFG